MENIIGTFQKIYNWLEDEESKEIYLNRLCFVISRDYRYMRNIISKYVPDMAALNDEIIPELLKSVPKDKDIILYGAGDDARANLHYVVGDKRFKGFCDRDVLKQQSGVDGYTVISPEDLLKRDCNILISTHRGYNAIKDYLISNGVEESRIHLMSPYLFAMQKEQYFNTDFLKFQKDEVFVDAGCCDMQTSLMLQKHCESIKKIYAFEPDRKNYEICKKIAKEYFPETDVSVICKGTWSDNKTLFFDATSDGASHISEQGNDSIEVTTIDEVVDGSLPVTFIKMDVEGAELESLKGAKETIQRDKPKLAICIYHKPEDMYDLPLYIKGLVPEYKLYLRHHSNGNGETVLYCV